MLVDALAEKTTQTGADVSSENLMKDLPNFSFSRMLVPTTFSTTNSIARREHILQARHGHLVDIEW
jgi:hypothetical protein